MKSTPAERRLRPWSCPAGALVLAASLAAAPRAARADPPSSDPADSQAAAAEADADHDAVPDPIDQCPAEAETWNGVGDDDGCPDATPQEVAVRGPIRAVVPLIGRRLQVAPEVSQVLDLVVRLLRANPGIAQLTIEGHTDQRGAEAWNLAVARARAEYVRNALLARGIAADRLVALGLGESCPAASGVGPAVWQRNRRVRFVVTRSHDARWPVEPVGCPAARAAGLVP